MMHTDETLWGPDASEFDPDRFLDERKKYMLANPFIFLPFNAGPRICLGQQVRVTFMASPDRAMVHNRCSSLARLQPALTYDRAVLAIVLLIHDGRGRRSA